MTETELRELEAVARCPDCGGDCSPECGLHPLGCVYGGFSAFTGYWLVAERCTLNHGEVLDAEPLP